MPGLKEFLFGKKDKVKQAPTVDPMSKELLDAINEGLTKGTGPFAGMFGQFDKKAFEEGVAKPEMQRFKEDILPQIQEKFIAGNQVLGSGMRRGQLRAARQFESDLARQLYEAQQNQEKNRLAGMQISLGTRPFENIYRQGNEGLVAGMGKGFAQGFGQGIGAGATGGVGAAGSAAAGGSNMGNYNNMNANLMRSVGA